MKKTLLLNANYEVNSFISEKRAFKLLYKEKVEIISSWNENISWISGKIQYPAILRLKNLFKRNFYNYNFSRNVLIKRDHSSCQYCLKKLSNSQITMDHVIPKVQGGGTSFNNCVVSCHFCNNRKGPRTPEQAGMKLLRKPTHPSFALHFSQHHITLPEETWHPDWDQFLKNC